jgi:predicted ABC-class ATPase
MKTDDNEIVHLIADGRDRAVTTGVTEIGSGSDPVVETVDISNYFTQGRM